MLGLVGPDSLDNSIAKVGGGAGQAGAIVIVAESALFRLVCDYCRLLRCVLILYLVGV